VVLLGGEFTAHACAPDAAGQNDGGMAVYIRWKRACRDQTSPSRQHQSLSRYRDFSLGGGNCSCKQARVQTGHGGVQGPEFDLGFQPRARGLHRIYQLPQKESTETIGETEKILNGIQFKPYLKKFDSQMI